MSSIEKAFLKHPLLNIFAKNAMLGVEFGGVELGEVIAF